jgi:histidyl-tRNA synthetase
MSTKYQVVKGFRDIFPPESRLFWLAELRARDLFDRYGYGEVILPIIEYYELFSRSIGDATDIVEKEMFIIADKKGRNLALRPEATASVVRAYVNGPANRGPQKLFYFGPMFRYERPQKGRYRQFWQVGAEAIGYPGPGIDAELMALLDQYFKGFGLDNIELKLNSLGCKSCRPEYRAALIGYLEKNQDALCEDCKRRLQKNPLRVLDCKNEPCREITKQAPYPAQFLCGECAGHFEKLRGLLGRLGLQYQVENHLVRGLDYYIRTVFEFQAKTGLGSQNAIAAGGRYDDLVAELGGQPAPGIGFALGVERLTLLLEEKIPAAELMSGPELFIIFAGDAAYDFSFKLLFAMRKSGLYADMLVDEAGRSMRSQFKAADKQKAKLALIIGDDELSGKALNLKILESGKELKLDHEGLKRMAEVDWEEMKSHLSTGAGFAFVSNEYEKSLAQNQNLFKIMKLYLDALENREG